LMNSAGTGQIDYGLIWRPPRILGQEDVSDDSLVVVGGGKADFLFVPMLVTIVNILGFCIQRALVVGVHPLESFKDRVGDRFFLVEIAVGTGNRGYCSFRCVTV